MKKIIILILISVVFLSCSNNEVALSVDDFVIIEKRLEDYSLQPQSCNELINSSRSLDIEYLNSYHQLARHSVFNHWYTTINGSDPKIFKKLISLLNTNTNLNFMGIGVYDNEYEHTTLLLNSIGGHTRYRETSKFIIYKGETFTEENTLFISNGSEPELRTYNFYGFQILNSLNIDFVERKSIRLAKTKLKKIVTYSFVELKNNPEIIEDKIVIITRKTIGEFDGEQSDTYVFNKQEFTGAEMLINSLLKLTGAM